MCICQKFFIKQWNYVSLYIIKQISKSILVGEQSQKLRKPIDESEEGESGYTFESITK